MPLNAFLSLLLAFDWMDVQGPNYRSAVYDWLEGKYGDPIDIAEGKTTVLVEADFVERFVGLLGMARLTLQNCRN